MSEAFYVLKDLFKHTEWFQVGTVLIGVMVGFFLENFVLG